MSVSIPFNSRAIKPTVSVVLPVYNAEKTLAAALASLCAQSLPLFEVLCVDNGSTDDSVSIIKQFAALDPRIRLMGEPQRGIVSALNTGIQAARGKAIARMDADDIAHPDRLQIQSERMLYGEPVALLGSMVEYGPIQPVEEWSQEIREELLAGGFQPSGIDPEKIVSRFFSDPLSEQAGEGYRHYVEWTNTLIEQGDIQNNRFVESPFAHPSVMLDPIVFVTGHRYRKGDFPEDYELWLRMLDTGYFTEKIDRKLLYWSDPADRLSRTHPAYRSEAFYRLKAHYLHRHLSAIHNSPHPEIVVIGASRLARKRAGFLEKEGTRIRYYIDFQARRTPEYEVRSWDDLPPRGTGYLVSYVASRGAREEIRQKLIESGYEEGPDFLFAA